MTKLPQPKAMPTKTLTLVLSALLVLASFPAGAAVFYPGPRIGIGFTFGYHTPYPTSDPWVYPYPYGYAPYPPVAPAQQEEEPATKLFAYPDDGQNAAQTAQDRTECNDWAVGQSGLDPATARKRAKTQHLTEYDRAFVACMEGRKYTVG